MQLVLIFAALLLVAVLIAERATRSVLSTSVLFLVGGFLAGPGGVGWLEVSPRDPVVHRFVEITLFAVLFTDGMRLRPGELGSAWRLAGRALALGMPLVFLVTAFLARVLVGLGWPHALLVGAVLAPTDPVFASALIGREEVPVRLRHLLNVESGLNDGLALPVVLWMIAVCSGGAAERPFELLGEVAAGLAVGVTLPWLTLRVKRRLAVESVPVYEPLLAFSIGLGVWAVVALTHANPFLAAFAAGVTVAATDEEACEGFRSFGEILAELLKLAALLLLGALIVPNTWSDLGLGAAVFAVLALLVARPLALFASLVASPLDWRERVTAAWFGPKGFASVAYALLVLRSGMPEAHHVFHVLALVVVLSILAHSSTDVLVARWFRRAESSVPRHAS